MRGPCMFADPVNYIFIKLARRPCQFVRVRGAPRAPTSIAAMLALRMAAAVSWLLPPRALRQVFPRVSSVRLGDTATSFPPHVYRTLRVASKEHMEVLAGRGITPRNALADCSVRDHVLRGSGSSWLGSQYISTTADLATALKFAAPFNPIVKIDLASFVAAGGVVIDLHDEQQFESHVPPDAGEGGEKERDAVLQRFEAAQDLMRRVLGPAADAVGSDAVLRDAKHLYEQAAQSPWECARLFSVRSEEMLLSGSVPASCVQLIDIEVTTNSVVNLPCGGQIPVSNLNELKPLRPDGGANTGRTVCAFAGEELVLQQAKPNVHPEARDATAMRFAIDSEFAAFSVYRLVEEHCPQMEVHVRDCAKLSFDISAENLRLSLGCLVFRQPHTLTPVRVGYELMDAAVYDALSEVCPTPLPPMRRLTPDDIVARWRAKAGLHPFGDADEKRFREINAGVEMFAVEYQIAPEFAPKALEGIAVDILLANVYGWGVYDKCSLAMDPTGRMYRLSADEALGNVISEHLNYDQREPSGNLCLRTLELAVGAMPMFGHPPPRFSTARGKTYEDVAGSLNNRLALRYTELLECMDTQADAFLAVTAGLGVPPEVHRLAGLYPDCKHLASLPAELLWRNYFRERCLFLQRTAVAAVRSEAEREVKRRSSAKPSDVWQRILSYASRLLNSAGMLRSVLRQRPDMAEAMAELQASSINAFAVVHPLVDFSLGAASAVPWLGEARSGMDPNENPFDGMFESEPGLELLELSSKLTQRDDIWAATSRDAPRITSAPDLLKLQEYTNANPDSYTTHAFQISFVHKWEAHQLLDEGAPDELVVSLLAQAAKYNRGAHALLMSAAGASMSDTYLFKVTQAADRILKRRPDSVVARIVLAANDLRPNQAQLYDEAIAILRQQFSQQITLEQHLALSSVMELAAGHQWTEGQPEAALRLWSSAFDHTCRAEMLGPLPYAARPSVELLYALGFGLTMFRRDGMPVPAELRGAMQTKATLTDELLYEILPVNLHRAVDCLSIYIKCAQPDSRKLPEAHYLLALDAMLSTAEQGVPSRDKLIGSILPQMKQHLAEGDAAFAQQPRLMAYDKDSPPIRKQVESIVKMLEL